MVSERQRLARKRYKEAHPELFPTPEPTPPKDPTKVKKKKSLFKRKKPVSNDPNKKNSFRKHPLRVPGMRPGDSCYICKANDHIAKFCPEKAQWDKNKICLSCRQRGHSLKNCPNKNEESADVKVCYNCGEAGHSLFNCPQPTQDGGTKFASCFICKGQGHLSKDCPKNAHGIYPKGGCCKICSGVTHLAKDCPEKGKRNPYAAAASGYVDMANMPRPQVTKFTSGDDLEDDFVMDDKSTAQKNTTVDPSEAEKAKKKQGTKVVNFVG